MTSDIRKKMHKVTEIVISFLLILVGFALIISCLLIYRSGDRSFSREIIAQYFQKISPVVFLLIAAVLSGWALHSIWPAEKKRVHSVRDSRITLETLSKKCSDHSILRREQMFRRIIKAGKYILIAIFSIYPVLYLSNPSNFSVSELNGDIADAAGIVLLATTICFAVVYIASRLEEASILREIDLCKSFLSAQKPETKSAPVGNSSPAWIKQQTTVINIIRAAVFLLAVCFIVLGVFNLGIDDVLGKAIRICTECIGLG